MYSHMFVFLKSILRQLYRASQEIRQAWPQAWKVSPKKPVQLIAMTPYRVTILADKKLWSISVLSGQTVWGPVDLNDSMHFDLFKYDRSRQKPREEAEIAHVAANDYLICVGDPHGRLVGIDVHSGETMWRQYLGRGDLSHINLNNRVLVTTMTKALPLSGSELFSLDPATGQQINPTKSIADLVWLSTDVEDLIVYATKTSLVGADLLSGTQIWQIHQTRFNLRFDQKGG